MPKDHLSPERLVENLAVSSSPLIEELLRVAREQLAKEDAREALLNAKASSLLAASGVSLTVTATFVAILLQHRAAIARVGDPATDVAVGLATLYALALVLGVLAAWQALRALLIRDDYRTLDDEEIFEGELLHAADSQGRQEDALTAHSRRMRPLLDWTPALPFVQGFCSSAALRNEADEGDEVLSSAAATPEGYYRRFLTAAVWRIYRANFDVNEDKAKKIARGQRFFFAFLLSIGIVVIGVTVSGLLVLKLGREPEPTPIRVDATCRLPDARPAANGNCGSPLPFDLQGQDRSVWRP